MAEKKTETKKPTVRAKSASEKPPEPRRLYRSRVNKYIGGVCGGVAEYFNLDPTLVRVLWVLSAFLNGLGVVAYIAGWIIIPQNPREAAESSEAETRPANASLVVGIILIGFGLIFLLRQVNWFHYYPFRWYWYSDWGRWFDSDVLLPLVIIVIGVVYLVNVLKKEKPSDEQKSGG